VELGYGVHHRIGPSQESRPESPELKESVVTRTVTHFKGDSLVGENALRPTSYTGHTLTGHFAAARKT
jgi:hypothetical protein